MIAAAPGLEVGLELRARLADLYCAYDDALNDGALERWPELFVETCVYKVIPRENVEQGLPGRADLLREPRHAGRSRRGVARDRAVTRRASRAGSPAASALRAIEADGLHLTANFAVFQTMPDQPSELFLCGCCQDRVVEDGGALRFAERLCIYDSTIVPTSLVYPI